MQTLGIGEVIIRPVKFNPLNPLNPLGLPGVALDSALKYHPPAY